MNLDYGYSAIQHTAMSLFLGGWQESVMAMLTAYFDASGNQDDSEAVVVAGFLSSTWEWLEFERLWNKCLLEFGVSEMHMKEFAPSTGEFESWKDNEDKRRRFINRLISIIKKYTSNSFADAVLISEYRKVDSLYQLYEYCPPYSLASSHCVGKIREWSEMFGYDFGNIGFIFEDGDKNQGNMGNLIKANYGFTPSFLKKCKSVAFQAADMLAYEHLSAHRKLIRNGLDKLLDFEDLRYPMRELCEIPGSARWAFHGEEDLTEGCIKLNIPMRKEGSKSKSWVRHPKRKNSMQQ